MELYRSVGPIRVASAVKLTFGVVLNDGTDPCRATPGLLRGAVKQTPHFLEFRFDLV